MAKIEVWSKDVKQGMFEFLNDPQHLYLVFTNDENQKEILRGGPENGNPIGLDELIIVRQDYNNPKQSDNSETFDWNDGTHQGEALISGSSEELSKVWEQMWETAESINSQKYDYEFMTQNSNTAVVQMTKSANLDEKVFSFLKTNNLKAPADTAEFNHSKQDRNYDFATALIQLAENTYKDLNQLKEALRSISKNPYIWLYEITQLLHLILKDELNERLNSFIQKLLGDIDLSKPILVLEESTTGRNELFIDQSTGQVFDRETLVLSIESGKFPSYKVASIGGISTPMSKADGVSSNNLG